MEKQHIIISEFLINFSLYPILISLLLWITFIVRKLFITFLIIVLYLIHEKTLIVNCMRSLHYKPTHGERALSTHGRYLK